MHLDRLMSILETVAIAGRPISAADLRELTDLPRPTCYRLLQSLAEHRFLDNTDSTSRYVIGKKLIHIAGLAKTDAEVSTIASATLKDAASQFGEAVFLSRFRNNRVAIIHVETPADPTISYVHPGLGYRPMHACSCSKAIAAFAGDEFRELVMKGPMNSYTDHTRTTRNELEEEFLDIKKRGFAECVEEIETGVSSIAAPIHIENAGVLFSVGAIGPIKRFHSNHRTSLGEQLIRLAHQVGSIIQFNKQLLSEI